MFFYSFLLFLTLFVLFIRAVLTFLVLLFTRLSFLLTFFSPPSPATCIRLTLQRTSKLCFKNVLEQTEALFVYGGRHTVEGGWAVAIHLDRSCLHGTRERCTQHLSVPQRHRRPRQRRRR